MSGEREVSDQAECVCATIPHQHQNAKEDDQLVAENFYCNDGFYCLPLSSVRYINYDLNFSTLDYSQIDYRNFTIQLETLNSNCFKLYSLNLNSPKSTIT